MILDYSLRKLKKKIRSRLPGFAIINKQIAISNLSEITEILDTYNIQHWLTDGTLLGMIRENDFLNHDNDTDLAVCARTFDPLALEDLFEAGFILERFFGCPDESFEFTVSRGGVLTDFFFFYEVGVAEKVRHSAYFEFDEDEMSARRLDYVYESFTLTGVSWKSLSCNIPSNPEKYLEQKYGSSWTSPQLDWDYALDPANVQVTNVRENYSPPRPPIETLVNLLR